MSAQQCPAGDKTSAQCFCIHAHALRTMSDEIALASILEPSESSPDRPPEPDDHPIAEVPLFSEPGVQWNKACLRRFPLLMVVGFFALVVGRGRFLIFLSAASTSASRSSLSR